MVTFVVFHCEVSLSAVSRSSSYCDITGCDIHSDIYVHYGNPSASPKKIV